MKLVLLWCCTVYLCLATGLLFLRAAAMPTGVFSELNPESITQEQLYEARHLVERGMWIDAGIVAGGVLGLVMVALWMTEQTNRSE